MDKFADESMKIPVASLVANKIPVASLYPDRYGLGKTKLYEYLGDLGIKPTLENRRSFITLDQLALLDRYVPIASDRQAAATFLSTLPAEPIQEQVRGIVHSAETSTPPWIPLLEAIAQLQQPPDPLALHRQLEEVVEHGWVLSSSQLREILGATPKEGDRRYGFTFSRQGRIGRQSGWRVAKC